MQSISSLCFSLYVATVAHLSAAVAATATTACFYENIMCACVRCVLCECAIETTIYATPSHCMPDQKLHARVMRLVNARSNYRLVGARTRMAEQIKNISL